MVVERVGTAAVTPAELVAGLVGRGDTKVMGRGEIDGIVLNTTGIGLTRRVVTDAVRNTLLEFHTRSQKEASNKPKRQGGGMAAWQSDQLIVEE